MVFIVCVGFHLCVCSMWIKARAVAFSSRWDGTVNTRMVVHKMTKYTSRFYIIFSIKRDKTGLVLLKRQRKHYLVGRPVPFCPILSRLVPCQIPWVTCSILHTPVSSCPADPIRNPLFCFSIPGIYSLLPRPKMFKVNLETLALMAAPMEELLAPDSECDNNAVEEGAPSNRQVSTPGISKVPTAETSAPPGPGSGSGRASGAPSVHPSLRQEGKDGVPTAAQIGARDTVAASVCPQLELLGDLSRSVGHGEAALVCSTLLRDEARTTETLR